MDPQDYQRFHNFLAAHECKVDYREFRTGDADEEPKRRRPPAGARCQGSGRSRGCRSPESGRGPGACLARSRHPNEPSTDASHRLTRNPLTAIDFYCRRPFAPLQGASGSSFAKAAGASPRGILVDRIWLPRWASQHNCDDRRPRHFGAPAISARRPECATAAGATMPARRAGSSRRAGPCSRSPMSDPAVLTRWPAADGLLRERRGGDVNFAFPRAWR